MINSKSGDTSSLLDGKYQVLHEIGSGACGTVYCAFQPELGRKVAIKILNIIEDSDGKERFLREARILSLLSHPNIVSFLHYGVTPEGLCYYAAELLEGEDLAQRIRRDGKMRAQELIPLFIAVCDGLEQAHAAGIIHRDLKPSNIFLTTQGQAKILDFGLAVQTDCDQRLTQEGTILGTVLYMSPEQATGQQATARSDIYSLGCVLYECLTGCPPFLGHREIEVLYRHVHEHADFPPNANKLPEKGLWTTIGKALEKDPQDRFASVAAFRASLLANNQDVELETQPMVRRATKTKQYLALFCTAFGAAACLALFWQCMSGGMIGPPKRPSIQDQARNAIENADFVLSCRLGKIWFREASASGDVQSAAEALRVVAASQTNLHLSGDAARNSEKAAMMLASKQISCGDLWEMAAANQYRDKQFAAAVQDFSRARDAYALEGKQKNAAEMERCMQAMRRMLNGS